MDNYAKIIIDAYDTIKSTYKVSKFLKIPDNKIRKILKENNILIKSHRFTKNNGFLDIPANFVNAIYCNARRHKVSCNITGEKLWKLFMKQDKLCVYSNIRINFIDNNISIIRIDKSQGYDIENIHLLDKNVGKIVKWVPYEKLLYWSKLINNPLSNKNNIIELYNNAHPNYKGYKNISGSYLCDIMKTARRRNINFDITNKEIWSIYESQNGCCNLSGIPIIFPKACRELNDNSVSIDRVDSNMGYVKTNIQLIHKELNKMKYNLDNNLFINMMLKINEVQNG